MSGNMLDLIVYKAVAELRVDASRAYLGILWWVAEPVLYLIAFYFVFAVGFRMGGPDYVPFLLCGLVHWKWFNSTVQSGSNCIAANRGLINQVYFHKAMLVAIGLASNGLKFLTIMAILVAFLAINGYLPDTAWVAYPIILLTQIILMAGVVSVLAVVVPFVPDIKLVIDNCLMIMFFSSGIFFDIKERPEQVQQVLYLNPMTGLIESYRDVLMYGRLPDWRYLFVVALVGLLLLALGHRLLTKFDRRFAKVLG